MPEDDTTPVYLVGIPAVDGRDVGRIRDALEIALRDTDVSDNYRYKVQSVVRNRVRKHFTDDVELLEEHFPEVHEMLVDEVCNDDA